MNKKVSQRDVINSLRNVSQMHEYALMITKTVNGFPGKTSEELQSMPDCWLNKMAVFSVDRILTEAEKRGYVSCKNSKNGLIYTATRAGMIAYNKYNSA